MSETSVNQRKVAMIGCGFVGSATAFALMESGLFSEMVLIDADKNRAEGEALDISHGLPFARPMKIYAGDYDDIVDAAIIIVTAGANQKPDETRLDLVQKNVGIFKSIIPEIAKRNCGGILLIVSNPVDILTYTALKLSGFPENRVLGSGTVLDTARLKYNLGEHLNVDSRSVHAFIIGEHGDSELYSFFLSAHSAWSDKLRRLYGPHRIQRDRFASPSAGCEFEKRLLDGCWPRCRISRFHHNRFQSFPYCCAAPPWDMAVSKSRNCCHPEQAAAGV